MKKVIKLSINCLSALFVMTLINGFAPLIGIIPFIGMDDLGYTLFHILILILTTSFIFLCIKKVMRERLITYRITKPHLKKEWFKLGFISVFIMYFGFIIVTDGAWKIGKPDNIYTLIIVVVITSLCISISEEMFFRGLLLGYIAKHSNIYWGLSISSILFGAVHIMNGNFEMKDLIQIIIVISIAGFFYGLLTIHYQTIWASIVVHFLFDITQLFDITTIKDDQSILEYVYTSSNQLITGGQYGSTASIITALSYIIIIIYFKNKIINKNICI